MHAYHALKALTFTFSNHEIKGNAQCILALCICPPETWKGKEYFYKTLCRILCIFINRNEPRTMLQLFIIVLLEAFTKQPTQSNLDSSSRTYIQLNLHLKFCSIRSHKWVKDTAPLILFNWAGSIVHATPYKSCLYVTWHTAVCNVDLFTVEVRCIFRCIHSFIHSSNAHP